MRVMTRDTLIAERVKNMETREIALFRGTKDENKRAASPDIVQGTQALVQMTSPNWERSPAYATLWSEIKGLREKYINQNNTPADLANLIQRLFVDVTRRVMEQIDFTSMINLETVNFDFPESVTLRELYKYRGKFDHIDMTNNSVNLIQQYSGAVASIIMDSFGLGWKDTLHNLLFNSLHSMQKVMQAVADAYVNERNDHAIGYIYATTFHASQQVAAAADANRTYDENLYTTYRAAYKLLKSLIDPQNGKIIATPSIALLCHSSRRWESERVIRGELERTFAGAARGNLVSALPIDQIWEHDGDSYTWGKESVSFAGCDPDKAYLLVPRIASYTAVKRPLTMEVGRGSVLQLSTEERAWYFCQQDYHIDFLGTSDPGGTITDAGNGFIVEIELPTDTYDT